MPERLQTFLIAISIIEGRHYAWTNMDSYVLVKIVKQKRTTPVKKSTDAPYYNEYFVFEFTTTINKFLDYNIKISVFQPGKFGRKRKKLGYFLLDVATVWSETGHQFYNKWAILGAPPHDEIGGIRGYLKVNIAILSKGEVPKIPPVTKNTDDIETNLLLPEGISVFRQRANFIFDIYRAENLISRYDESTTRTTFDEEKQYSRLDSYIEINFAGSKVKTSVIKNTNNPIWDERLIITEPFPTLCQRIEVKLFFVEAVKKPYFSVRYIYLKSISSDREHGFLPTYGPNFLHFYGSKYVEDYVGSLLMEMNTELLDVIPVNLNLSGVRVPHRSSQQIRYSTETTYLFGTIFNVTTLNKKYRSRSISFKLTQGHINAHQRIDAKGDSQYSNVTVPVLPKRTNKDYWHLPFQEEKPCLYLTLSKPTFKKRMYNLNMLEKIQENLKQKLVQIQDTLDMDDLQDQSQVVGENLLTTVEYVETSLKKYLDLTASYNVNGNKLDNERIRLGREEILAIVESVENLYTPKTKRKCFKKLQNIHLRIKDLVDEIQDALPDVYIWMYSGKSKVAFCKIPARNLMYSNIEEEKGALCGEIFDTFFQPNGRITVDSPVPAQFACKVRLLLWLGLERHIPACLQILPSGFSFGQHTLSSLPEKMTVEESHTFQCRSHIFQGRLLPGADKSGLCDPFVRIVIGAHSLKCEVIRATLNPIWDQTLTFQGIDIYGSRDYIRSKPRQIFIEVLDQDECYGVELVGRAVAYPIIKFLDEPYTAPNFPPRLQWYKVYDKLEVTAEILAAFEFLEISRDPNEIHDTEVAKTISHIPVDIKPELSKFKMEVLFWGMRDLKKIQMRCINKPRMTVLCAEKQLDSDTINNAAKNPNFTNCIMTMDVILPVQEVYIPPIRLEMFDSRNFGIYVYAGTNMVHIKGCIYHPLTADQRKIKLAKLSKESLDIPSTADSVTIVIENEIKDKESSKQVTKINEITVSKTSFIKRLCKKLCSKKKKIQEEFSQLQQPPSEPTISEEDEQVDITDFDWWTKFYASLEVPEAPGKYIPLARRNKLRIYSNELEDQPEFSGFCDILQYFPIYSGKKTGDDAVDHEHITGVFKGSMRIYRWPLEDELSYVTSSGLQLAKGIFQDFPSNEPLRYLLRVYCVRAIGLRPKDLNGKSDPYLVVTLNNKIKNDRQHIVMRQLNPVFGRCFEFNATLPIDNKLTVAVWDWDLTTQDDLIGETKIDVENRFYTHHRAMCGIPDTYQESGYCEWRDQYKPTQILENLCRRWNLEEPVYTEVSVSIGAKQFILEGKKVCNKETCSGIECCGTKDCKIGLEVDEATKEVLALAALRRWPEMPLVGRHLVPEHVETRSLYNRTKPGIEQGKIQLWLDIFPYTDVPPPKQVTIVPRKPVAYELRIIIWNTDEIPLDEDDFFFGERKSDIYVKGWLVTPEEAQYTDVHYRSLSGEGNFNWRFVFKFEYLSSENKLVFKKKDTFFALEETEYKIPCAVTIQVWDNDTFSADDFLGTITLELSRLPRGAPSVKKCQLSSNSPRINIFKIKRTKGWWPFTNTDKGTGAIKTCGKLEAEFELVTAEEAANNPVGKGRDDPRGLPKPNRPDTSFSWFRNPLKALKYLCKKNLKRCLKCLILVLMALGVFIGIYSLPGYSIKKLLHV